MFKVGDKVLCYSCVTGAYTGKIGVIVKIIDDSNFWDVKFPDNTKVTMGLNKIRPFTPLEELI